MCGICGKGKNTCLCKKCENKLKLEAVFGKDKYQDTYFENHFYIFKYEGMVRNLILNYKFKEKIYLYESFVKFFNKYQKQYLQLDFYDIIIPVPISQQRLKTRGYNQSLLLARGISKELNTKLEANCLIKTKNNDVQSTLNKERKKTKCEKCLSINQSRKNNQ